MTKPLSDEEIEKIKRYAKKRLDYFANNKNCVHPEELNAIAYLNDVIATVESLKEECQLRWNEGEVAISECQKLKWDIKCLEESTVDKKAWEKLKEENEKLKEYKWMYEDLCK